MPFGMDFTSFKDLEKDRDHNYLHLCLSWSSNYLTSSIQFWKLWKLVELKTYYWMFELLSEYPNRKIYGEKT